LEELERKLLELEKSTQIKPTSTATSFQTDLTIKKNSQGGSEIQKKSRVVIQSETGNRVINSNYEHILKEGVDFDNNYGDSSPLIYQRGESIERREGSSTQDFRGSNVRNYAIDKARNQFEQNSSESEEKSQNRSSSKLQGNTPTGSQTKNLSRFEGQQRINQNIEISEYEQGKNTSSQNNSYQNTQNLIKNRSSLENDGLDHDNVSSKVSMNPNQIISRGQEEFFIERTEGKQEYKKQSQLGKGSIGTKTLSFEGRASEVSPLNKEDQDGTSQPDKSPSDRSIVEMESEDYQSSRNETIQIKQNSNSLLQNPQNNMERRINFDNEERFDNQDNSSIKNQYDLNQANNINNKSAQKQRSGNERNSGQGLNEEIHQASEFNSQQNFSQVNLHNASSSNYEQIQAENGKNLSMNSVIQSKGAGSPYSGQNQKNQFNNQIAYQNSAEVDGKNNNSSPVHYQQISQGGSTAKGRLTQYGNEIDNQEQFQDGTFKGPLSSSNVQSKDPNSPFRGQGQRNQSNNKNLYQESSEAQNRNIENNNVYPQQISQSGVLIRGNSSEYAHDENESQEAQKSKGSGSKNIHSSHSHQRKAINQEEQEENYENQGYHSGGRTVQKQNSQNSGSLGMINKELEVISEEKPIKSSSKKSKKKQQKETNQNLHSDPNTHDFNHNNKGVPLSENREDHSNVYSVYSRSNSNNQEEIAGTLKSNPDLDKTPRDEKRVSQSFKIQ